MRAIYVIGALLALMLLAAPVAAASVDPVLFPEWQSGNAAFECEQAGCECPYAYKIDKWGDANEWGDADMDGAYQTDEGNTFTISNSDDATFDWESDYPVCAVIVKAGQGANVYYYNGAYSDTGLVAPYGKDISHVTFCFSDPPAEQLTVTKTAVTSYTRTHKWSICKSVETENGCTHEGSPKIWLYIDGSGDEKAIWTVNVAYGGYDDSDYNVAGVITIKNTGKVDAVITSIEDLLGGTPVTVYCDGDAVTEPCSYNLPAGDTLTCTYTYGADDRFTGCNIVTVTTEKNTYSASVPIVWGEPTYEVNKEVTIKDISDLFGERILGMVTAPDCGSLTKTFTYCKHFAWTGYGKDNCGDFTYDNIASIVETGQFADATLNVNVQCYLYETAYAKGDPAVCFIPTFNNWGWTNPIVPDEYNWPLWAGAGQCDTSKGTLVGTVDVVYGTDGNVNVDYNVDSPNSLEETHVYAGYNMFPLRKGKQTVAPGQYTNEGPFDGKVYVIAHAVVGIPDPNFGP